MKTEDYLWDKTGEDPEIEQLENALAVFRYKETAPPAMPAKVLPFRAKSETPRSIFRFAYAAAACLAFAAVALGVWFQIADKKTEVAANPSETQAPPIENKIPVDAPVKVSDKSIEAAPKQTIKRKIVKIKKPVYQIKAARRNVETKTETAALTKEEKYAYDQLMLALSITGSKLRLVSDKIEGVGNENPVNKNGQ